ncbi:hypothetical protein HID58_054774 [Brassica napus]|uniref:histidinol dehydrogenase n=3 Tax=Brassica TaxID=3705 RepID=A0A816IDR9_BRANA|nr:hypothetical protein HID58_054774 [Brassica napus]CAF1706817.1 unnamed protein product [Brassica napus]
MATDKSSSFHLLAPPPVPDYSRLKLCLLSANLCYQKQGLEVIELVGVLVVLNRIESLMLQGNSEAMVLIDMPAGPSEVLFIADEHASPVYIAADLLSQAITFSNMYAPEHLIINVKDAEKWEGLIENACSVFIGPWTPESVGDYASGTNHVLPTYGYVRMYSGVSLDSFLKFMTVQSLTEEGLRNLGPYVATMAEIEGLDAHKRAVTLRLKDIEARQPFQTK